MFYLRYFLFCLMLLPAASINAAATTANYTVLPLTFINGYPSTIITIQGKKIPLFLDLGAAKIEVAISPAILQRFNIKIKYTTEETQRSEDIRGIKSARKKFILPEAQLGNFIIKSIKGVQYHPWGGNGAPENGVIGLDLLARFNVIIDYKNRTLFLITGNNYPSGYAINSWPKVPFTMDGNIITQAKVDNKTIALIWDTGATLSFIESGTKLMGEVKNCPASVATAPTYCKMITTTDFILGNHNFGRTVFYARTMPGLLPINGLLGKNFFDEHVVYISFAEKILAISP